MPQEMSKLFTPLSRPMARQRRRSLGVKLEKMGVEVVVEEMMMGMRRRGKAEDWTMVVSHLLEPP